MLFRSPDRDYYLSDSFAKQREGYVAHMIKMLELLGDNQASATTQAKAILDLETALAKASKSRTDLRDEEKNYFKFTMAEVKSKYPTLEFSSYFSTVGVEKLPDLVLVALETQCGYNMCEHAITMCEQETVLVELCI